MQPKSFEGLDEHSLANAIDCRVRRQKTPGPADALITHGDSIGTKTKLMHTKPGETNQSGTPTIFSLPPRLLKKHGDNFFQPEPQAQNLNIKNKNLPRPIEIAI